MVGQTPSVGHIEENNAVDRTYVLLLPTVRFRCLKFVIGCLEADFTIYFRSKTCNHECILGCRHTCIQTDRQTGPRPQPSQAGQPARQADRQAGRQANKQTDSTYITSQYITLHYTTFHSIPLRCITLHTWCAPSLGHFFWNAHNLW